jgi:N-acetylneuraminic acid mutarotase
VADLPRPLHHIGTAVATGVVFSIGGFIRNTFNPGDDVAHYDAAEDAWMAGTRLPVARGALAVAELDGLLHAVGGSGAAGSLADHTVYDPLAQRWEARAPLPSRRNHLAAVSLGGYVYVIGGRSDGGGNANTGELDRYDPSTDRWEIMAPMPTARSGHAAAVLNGWIVTMGGEVNADNPPTGVFVEVELYDPDTDTWATIDPMAVPRHGIGGATVGELVYVPGGAIRAGFAATDHHDALQIW